MANTKKSNSVVKVVTTENKIIQHMNDFGIKFSWLAEKVGVSKGHLHLVLKGGKDGKEKRELCEDLKNKINLALGTSF